MGYSPSAHALIWHWSGFLIFEVSLKSCDASDYASTVNSFDPRTHRVACSLYMRARIHICISAVGGGMNFLAHNLCKLAGHCVRLLNARISISYRFRMISPDRRLIPRFFFSFRGAKLRMYLVRYTSRYLDTYIICFH